jgi:hypothetical protein
VTRAAPSRFGLRSAAPHLQIALVPWVVARAIVLTAVLIGRTALDRGYDPPIPVVLAHTGLMSWDADWYRRIAEHGYGGIPRNGLRFFPLYPLLGRVVGFVLGGRVDWGLLAIANVLALVLGALVHHLVLVERGDRELARRAVWLMALAPPAFVLVMGYSEPLFLCLTVGAFVWMRQGRWWWVAGAGLLAGLTRPVGILLAVPVFVVAAREVWGHRGAGRVGVGVGGLGVGGLGVGGLAARLAAVVAPAAGTGAYLAYVGIRFGDPLLPFRVQDIPGLRGDTVNPLVTLGRAAAGTVTGHFGRQLHHPWVLVLVVLVVLTLRRWPLEYGAYAAVTVVAALAAEHLGSLERYGYGGFPVVLAVATVTRSPRVERVVLALSAAGMGAYAVAAFVGAYVP